MKTAYLTLGLFTALTSAYSRRHPRYMRIARQNNGTIPDTPDVSGVPLSTAVSSDTASFVTSAAPVSTGDAVSGITTLTVSTTSVRTVTSCLPEVIDCPTRTEDFADFPTEALSTATVTDTVILTEVVCPVTAVPSISSSVLADASNGLITGSTLAPSETTSTLAPSETTSTVTASETTSAATPPTSDAVSGITTLTVSTTSVRTITSCLPEVIDCPTRTEDLSNLPTEALSTATVTDTIILTEVVCPVTAVPSISSSVIADATNGIITGSTLTPSETATPGASVTESLDAIASSTTAAPAEQDTTTTQTITSTGTRTVTVEKPVTTTVAASPGGGNGAGNGNGNGNGNGAGNNDNDNGACVCPPATTVTEAAVTVTEPASTVYVTVTDSAAGVGGGNGNNNGKPATTSTSAAPAATTTTVSNETGEAPELPENDSGSEAPGGDDEEQNEEEDCPADEVVTVTSTSTAASATSTGSAIPSAIPSEIPELDGGAEAPETDEGEEDEDSCPEDEVVTVTASASATEAPVAPSVAPSVI